MSTSFLAKNAANSGVLQSAFTPAHVKPKKTETAEPTRQAPQGEEEGKAENKPGLPPGAQQAQPQKKLVRKRVRRQRVGTSSVRRGTTTKAQQSGQAQQGQEAAQTGQQAKAGKGRGVANHMAFKGTSTQASVMYEQAARQQTQGKQMSPTEKRFMILNGLRAYTNNEYKALQSNPQDSSGTMTRKAARELCMALTTLSGTPTGKKKDSKTEDSSSNGEPTMTSADFKRRKTTLAGVMQIFAPPPEPPPNYEPIAGVA